MQERDERDHEVAQLFKTLFEHGDLVEIRTIGPGQDIRQRWIEWGLAFLHPKDRSAGLRGILDEIEPLAERSKHGLYFGVNPRKDRGGKAEDVALARCLFVDFDDSLDGSKGCTREHALQRVEDAGLPFPSAVVSSGGGIHCYWRLAEPMTDLAAWSSLQRAIIRRVQSDKVVHDAPRVMRLPGMLNAKRDRMAHLLHHDEHRVYDLMEFDAFIEDAKRADEAMKERAAAVEVKAGGMSEMTRSLVEHGTLLRGGGRRQSVFAAACDLKARGWSERDAAALLLPAGERLGLDSAEVDDLRRQIHNAFKKERLPYSFDPAPIVDDDEPQSTKKEPALPTLDEQLEAFMQYRAGNRGRRLVGLETGFAGLDRQLSGMHGLSILAAAPGAGKTSLTLQLGLQILHRNPKACFMFFSAEMQAREIAGRFLTMATSLDYRRLALPGLTSDGISEKVEAADNELIERAIADMKEVSSRMRIIPPDLIIDAANRGDLAQWMQRRTEETMEATGTTEVVATLDNLQQSPWSSTRGDGSFTTDIERDRFAIESMMRLQHGLSNQADRVATIAVSEVSKAAIEEARADMTAIIGSIRSVYKADAVMVASKAMRTEKAGRGSRIVDLFAPRSGDPTKADFGRRCVDLIVSKARAPAERGWLVFAFDHRRHRMEEIHEADAIRVPREHESDEVSAGGSDR